MFLHVNKNETIYQLLCFWDDIDNVQALELLI